MRKYLIGFIVGVIITIPVTAFGQIDNIKAYLNPNVKITVDGEPIQLETTPIIYEQTTYLPLREISEKVMGMSVGWNQETSTVELTTEEAWPTTDVTKRQIEGDNVKTKDDVDFGTEYPKLFVEDDSSDIDTIKGKIKSIEYYIELFNKEIEEFNSETATETETIFVERSMEEIPKLQEALTYWQSLKDQKEAESMQEQ